MDFLSKSAQKYFYNNILSHVVDKSVYTFFFLQRLLLPQSHYIMNQLKKNNSFYLSFPCALLRLHTYTHICMLWSKLRHTTFTLVRWSTALSRTFIEHMSKNLCEHIKPFDIDVRVDHVRIHLLTKISHNHENWYKYCLFLTSY